ncbi:FAD-dependent monooxygenase [Streptomyces sp. NPDC057074]|uniref:FAD-dependent monooxygenase n=1 Tax=Streptomyces sp. NPDC057074 TaxID=3346015 RepID=UPI00363B37E2
MSPRTFAVIGGGPAGLFLARLLRLRDPAAEVTVHERNAPDATFGFGVVFSDRTMAAFEAADPETCIRLRQASVRWTDMEVRHRGRHLRYGGYGFTAISRRTLLRILQEQAGAAGANLRFRDEVSAVDVVGAASVVAVADGANSRCRQAHADAFGTTVDASGPRYIWFGTPARFEHVTFPFVESRFGAFAAHAYPYEAGTSTFIVETDQATWRAAGMDLSTAGAQAAGASDEHSRELLEEVFKEHLDGHPLLVNNSKWSAFRVVRNERWSHRNMVLLGDAAHTAHFSVGSGTKMAMEDAIALATALGTQDTASDAFSSYEQARRPAVRRTQDWADPSMRWWASFGRRLHLEPEQFGFHFLTRTGAMSYSGLIRRHRARVEEVESWFTRRHAPARTAASPPLRSALALPVTLGGTTARNRVATVSTAVAARAQQRDIVSFALARCGLSAVDWSPPAAAPARGSAPDPAAWRAAVDRAREHGGEPMAMVRLGDTASEEFACAVGFRLIERIVPTTAGETATVPVQAGGPTVVIGAACPRVPVHSAQGEEFVDRCSALAATAGGVHLHLPDAERTADRLTRALDYADQIRERSHRPVLLDGPGGWALSAPDAPGAESWATRFHAAVLAGRCDIVVAPPLLAA